MRLFQGSLPLNSDTISADLIDNQTVFNVEKILQKWTINRQTQYLIKCANYPLFEATWEPECNILDPRLLTDFTSPDKDLS